MLQKDISLRDFTSFKIGGKAGHFFAVESEDEFQEAVREISRMGKAFFILGGGTNILVKDEGFEGFILRIANRELEIGDDGLVSVGAGFDMQELVHETAKRGLAGLEWAGGLPGTIGGAIRGNAGCFGGEIKDVVESVESLYWDEWTNTWQRKIRPRSECKFGYRSSIYKLQPEIVVNVRLQLRPGGRPQDLLRAVAEKIEYRRERHPLEYPNAGSIFKNIPLDQAPADAQKIFINSIKVDPFPVIPTAKVLAEAGLKGIRVGNAQISPKHPNFIVNLGEASDKDVKALIEMEKKIVWERFGIKLEEEIQFV